MAEGLRLPDFIIGGAPRSGTTFLCHALERHPGIFLAKPYIPEPKVFMGPPRSAAEYIDRYRALFADAKISHTLGEKTSYYLESEQACRLIHATVPQVRMVFLVREPVSRAYSNYLWTRKNGFETLAFEQAVLAEGTREDPMPPERAYARPFDYLSRGDYATYLRRYFDAFGRERVAVFLYEDILLHPAALLADVQRFIGVEPLPFHRLDPGIVNAARELGPPLDPKLEQALRRKMRPYVERFRSLTGLDLTAWGYS